jgi:hypothetical protein
MPHLQPTDFDASNCSLCESTKLVGRWVLPAQRSSSTAAPTNACELIPLAKWNDPVAAITFVATVPNCFVPQLPGAPAFRGISTEPVFERSASVDIIRVSAVVTVTVEIKQQAWTKQSLPQRYSCVGCQLNSDHALRSLCLKGHVRARGSTQWRHRWQEASEFLCTKTPLFGGIWATKKMAKKPRKCFLRRAINIVFSKFRGWRRKKKPHFARFQLIH